MRWRFAKPATTHRSGTVTAWLIVCLSVIVGVVGMGMDGGRMMEERRSVQMAADAAALTAANNLYLNWPQNQGTDPSDVAKGVALSSALANGYADDGTSSIVTVNIPPQSGAFAGKAEYVEVIIQSNLKGSFSAVFTRSPLVVRARAVARGRPQNIGLIMLQNSGIALSAGGTSKVNVPGAPIVVNSPASPPYYLTGSASVSALYHDLAGTMSPMSAVAGTINSNVPPAPDPLRTLAAPNSLTSPLQLNGLLAFGTLQPGLYLEGINVIGNSSVTMMPGLYVLGGGGLHVSGNASLTGDKVLIYNTGGLLAGSISISNQATVQLTPPTSGAYQQISIFQDRNVSSPIIVQDTATVQISGTVYAPAASIQVSDTAALGSRGAIVSGLQASVGASFTVNGGSNRPLAPEIGIVE